MGGQTNFQAFMYLISFATPLVGIVMDIGCFIATMVTIIYYVRETPCVKFYPILNHTHLCGS